MPTNTSVHKTNEYDNITTSSFSPSRPQPLSFSPLKKGQQANYDYKKNSLNENNKNFTSHKARNFNFIKENVAHHRNYSRNCSIDRKKNTFATTSLLTKTNKLTKTPIKVKKSNENFVLNNKATQPVTTTKTKPNHKPTSSSLTEKPRNSSRKTPNNKNSTSSEDYFRLFEKLKSKAEYFADKDPAFTARLLGNFNKYCLTLIIYLGLIVIGLRETINFSVYCQNCNLILTGKSKETFLRVYLLNIYSNNCYLKIISNVSAVFINENI